jgi:DNA gyrase subunit A
MGRNARGVNGIKLREDTERRAPSVEGRDAVVGLVAIGDDDDRDLLTVTWHGYGKRTPLSEYRAQSRYGYGLVDIKTNERNGHVVAVKAVGDDDDLFIMSEGGQIMRTHAGEVSEYGRNTQGVRVMKLDEGDWVASVAAFTPATETDAAETDASAPEAPEAPEADAADAADAADE